MPGDLIGIGGHSVRNHGLMHAEPVRAQAAAVDEREQQARQATDAHLFGQLPRGSLFIGFADTHGATDHGLVETGEARQLLRPPMDEDPATFVTTHRRGDSVQPTLPDRLPTGDHPQDTILIVDTLHQFIHEAQPGRAH